MEPGRRMGLYFDGFGSSHPPFNNVEGSQESFPTELSNKVWIGWLLSISLREGIVSVWFWDKKMVAETANREWPAAAMEGCPTAYMLEESHLYRSITHSLVKSLNNCIPLRF